VRRSFANDRVREHATVSAFLNNRVKRLQRMSLFGPHSGRLSCFLSGISSVFVRSIERARDRVRTNREREQTKREFDDEDRQDQSIRGLQHAPVAGHNVRECLEPKDGGVDKDKTDDRAGEKPRNSPDPACACTAAEGLRS
jgi:hypothetical protein